MTPKSPRKSAATPPAQPADEPSFEEALAQLEAIVEQLEDGSLPLEEALARFERGIGLSRQLERQLRRAEARVRRLAGEESAGGEPELSDFEEPADSELEPPDDEDDDAASDDDGSGRLPF